MKRPLLLVAALVGLSTVSACGLTGDLKRPAPLFGHPGQDVEPADLPQTKESDLPPLPEREPAADPESADDELLGGPSGG
jgi:predicted small lipoprotein YifL